VFFNADAGTLGAENGTTDASGQVSVSFDYEVANGFDVTTILALIEPVQGYIAASASIKVEGYNEPTTMAVTEPTAGAELDSDTVTIAGTVDDPEGVTTVQIIVDGGTPINVTVSAGAFTYELTDLAEGSHTVTVRAIDDQGDTTDTDVQFTVALAGEDGELPWLWIIIAIIVIVVVVLILMMVMRSRAAPAEPEEEALMEEEEAPGEEELVEEPEEESMEEMPSEEAESETLSEE
jgi:flagellar biosynthesis/type III secretory pathway M-ring protein FliF/YscJ